MTMRYGRAIKLVRTAYGLTQAQLAERLSVGASHLSLIEAERRKPSLEVLEEIANALGVPVHLLALLASDAYEIDDPKNAEQIAEVARTLLRLLVSADKQPTLPIRKKKSA
jgi:transcriptional regulator with XRE-family HTH domain